MMTEKQIAVTSHSPNALATVEQEIARACKDANRDRASVTLIAVSKTFDADAITPVIEAGQHVFGENRVQEAKSKWPPLLAGHPGVTHKIVAQEIEDWRTGGAKAGELSSSSPPRQPLPSPPPTSPSTPSRFLNGAGPRQPVPVHPERLVQSGLAIEGGPMTRRSSLPRIPGLDLAFSLQPVLFRGTGVIGAFKPVIVRNLRDFFVMCGDIQFRDEGRRILGRAHALIGYGRFSWSGCCARHLQGSPCKILRINDGPREDSTIADNGGPRADGRSHCTTPDCCGPS